MKISSMTDICRTLLCQEVLLRQQESPPAYCPKGLKERRKLSERSVADSQNHLEVGGILSLHVVYVPCRDIIESKVEREIVEKLIRYAETYIMGI